MTVIMNNDSHANLFCLHFHILHIESFKNIRPWPATSGQRRGLSKQHFWVSKQPSSDEDGTSQDGTNLMQGFPSAQWAKTNELEKGDTFTLIHRGPNLPKPSQPKFRIIGPSNKLLMAIPVKYQTNTNLASARCMLLPRSVFTPFSLWPPKRLSLWPKRQANCPAVTSAPSAINHRLLPVHAVGITPSDRLGQSHDTTEPCHEYQHDT